MNQEKGDVIVLRYSDYQKHMKDKAKQSNPVTGLPRLPDRARGPRNDLHYFQDRDSYWILRWVQFVPVVGLPRP